MQGAIVISADLEVMGKRSAGRHNCHVLVHRLLPTQDRVEVIDGDVFPRWEDCDAYEVDSGESNSRESRSMLIVGVEWLWAHRNIYRTGSNNT